MAKKDSPAARLLSVGQLITIVPDSAAPEGNGAPEAYPSRIEDLSEDALLVSMPMRQMSLVALPLNSAVSIYFSRGGARYYFRAIVASLATSPLPVLRLRDVGSVMRQERRNHVRVGVAMEPVQMVAVGDDPDLPPDSLPAIVLDISGGGLGLVCPRPLAAGTMLHVVLDLPGRFGRLEADAEVVRSIAQELGGTARWQVGVTFRKMPGKQRDRIAAFALYQQQLLRRRGLQ